MHTFVCKQQLTQGAGGTCTPLDCQACGSCLEDVTLSSPKSRSSFLDYSDTVASMHRVHLMVLPARRLSLTLFQRASLVLMSALPSSVNQSRRSMPCRMSAF